MKKSKKIPIEKLLFVIPILIILISFLILLFKGQLNFGTINFENLGGYGSFIGGLVGTFLTIIATYYIYKTYHSQKNQLKKQKKQLKLQSVLTAQQQFESTFFNMLNVHRELKNGLKIDKYKYLFINNSGLNNSIFGLDVFLQIKSDFEKFYDSKSLFISLENINLNCKINSELQNDLYNNDNLFKNLEDPENPEDYLENIGNIDWSEDNDLKEYQLKKINFYFKYLFKNYQNQISHYCRNVYHILKYSRENEQNETLGKNFKKYQNYANIFQSQLNVDEQFLLFYNFIYFNDIEKGDYSTILLVNNYSFLENLGSNNLINEISHNNKNFYSFDIK